VTHGSAHSSSILLAVAAVLVLFLITANVRRIAKAICKFIKQLRKGAAMVATFFNAAIASGDWAGT
jgi:Sec-independent protein translocase protein TatA